MPDNTQQILELETRFWQTLKDKDSKAAGAMIADDSLATGAQGTMRMNPDKFEEMTRNNKWALETFEFSDVDVIFPSDDVAVIAYTVHQTGTIHDGPMDLTCVDASTWVRNGDGEEWKCALHTETILETA